MNNEARALNAALRRSLTSFTRKAFQAVVPGQAYIHGLYVEALCWHLQQVAEGKITRLLVTLPPRYLKSIAASVALPAWILGHDPSVRIICASYSAELAGKHALDCRAVMSSPWYQSVFPRTRLSAEKNTTLDFMTTRRGSRYSTSVGGTLTGRGGDLMIIDDPLKADDAFSETKRSGVNEWFHGTLYSRLDDKRTGAIIIVMQRLHVEDLAGHVLERGGWTHLNLPAIAEEDQLIKIGPRINWQRKRGGLLHPKRESKEELERTKAALGSFNFSAHYQQNPIPADGEIIRWSWFNTYDFEQVRRVRNDRVVQSWDTASKTGATNDYSVCTTWLVQGNLYFLVDVLRERLVYPDLKRKIVKEARRHHAEVVLIEDAGSGTGLLQDLHREGPADVPKPIPIRPERDKVTRMQVQSAKIEAGHVYLLRRAEWLDDFRAEVLQFPHGRYDDQVDSVSQFLGWIQARQVPELHCIVTPIYSVHR